MSSTKVSLGELNIDNNLETRHRLNPKAVRTHADDIVDTSPNSIGSVVVHVVVVAARATARASKEVYLDPLACRQ
jgi:hypothetical protein